MIIDTLHFLNRIGEPDEQPCDRRFWSAMSMWKWRADWKAAEENEDWAELDCLSKKYDMIVGI